MSVKNQNSTYTKSHFGVYALIEFEGTLLLVKKSQGPYCGLWDLPGGRPEYGESLFEALQRELFEETGLRLKQATIIKSVFFSLDYQKEELTINFHHEALIFKATDFDLSRYDSKICMHDVEGCAMVPISSLKSQPLSRLAFQALEPLYVSSI